MGGGYGSKFGPDIQGIVAAELARKAGAPVKLMLDRDEEVTVGGNRPSAYGKVKIGGHKDGTITAYEVDCYGSPGETGGRTVNIERVALRLSRLDPELANASTRSSVSTPDRRGPCGPRAIRRTAC